MTALILALDGPLQAWGVDSRFTRRETENAPTKSAVVGLLASAMGRTREDSLNDLAALRFGVRTDQQGSRLRDFQTEIDWRTGRAHPLTERFYLQDYKFLAAVEGPRDLLDALDFALRKPANSLFLGRRSCPPARRVSLGLTEETLNDALANAPWIAAEWFRRKLGSEVHLPIQRDASPGESPDRLVRDMPVSFDPRHRRYALRPIVHTWTAIRNNSGTNKATQHDPFSLLERG